MRIGIVTAVDDVAPNYGNKLQNYAAEQIYIRMGHKCITLSSEWRETDIVLYIKRIANILCFNKLLKTPDRIKRKLIFHKFDRDHLHISFELYKGRVPECDYYSAGSDQIWNPKFYNNEIKPKNFFLDFCDTKKKIALAPSMGEDTLPVEWHEHFKNMLMTFDKLSVREESGAKIIKELTGKDATVLCDPTFMLDREDWQKIEKKPRYNVDEKYILTYFLGDASPYSDFIKKTAEENGMQIINLEFKNQGEYWKHTGPSEFLWLMSHSSLVFTDSFHAVVFSIINKLPFAVFKRQDKRYNMQSRFNTLLKKFNLENRCFPEVADEDLFFVDYSGADAKIAQEREKTNDYLRSIIGE